MPKDPWPRERLDIGAGTPLFDSAKDGYPDRYETDEVQRLDMARGLLIRSDYSQLTSDHVWVLMEKTGNGHWLGNGLWIGMVFRHKWFQRVGSVKSKRGAAKGRWIQVYALTPAGQQARAGKKGHC